MKNKNNYQLFLLPVLFLFFAFCDSMSKDVCAGESSASENEAIYTQANALSNAFRTTSKKVLPAVVQVVTLHDNKNAKNKNIPEELVDELPEELKRDSIGTGFIVDSSGIVLTNDHVIADQNSIVVELYDQRRFTPTKICRDSLSDIAVIFLKTDEPLPALTLADSDKIEIGDWVLAIGTPLSLESSVSAGIISATKRILDNKLGHVHDSGVYLQTDAAINPGNSGGPLVNLRGEVVGINSSIAGKTGLNHGIGFAIPSNKVRWIMNQLKENGEVKRAHLGIQVSAIPYRDRMDLKLPTRQGIRLSVLFKDSPAVKAGLQKNDILLSFDGLHFESTEEFRSIVEAADPQQEHRISFIRDDNKKMELPIQVAIPPKDYVGVPQTEKIVKKGSFYKDPQLGLMLIPVTPGAARNLGIQIEKGLIVLNVSPSGIAHDAGFKVGTVILSINGKKITNSEEYREAIKPLQKGIELKFDLAIKKEKKVIVIKPEKETDN